MDFGERLRAAMEAQGVSARQLALRLFGEERWESGRRQVTRWMKVKRPPRFENIEALAEALDVDLMVLVRDPPTEDGVAAALEDLPRDPPPAPAELRSAEDDEPSTNPHRARRRRSA